MGNYAFQATCDHTGSCPDGGANPEDAVYDVRDADIPTGPPGSVVRTVSCPVCSCAYAIKIQSTGRGYESADVAVPRIDSIDVSTGGIAGGTSVSVTGHRLNTTGLAVKFGGVAATGLSNQSDTNVDCSTPAGVIRFLAAGAIRRKLAFDNLSGTFQADETVTGGTSGATAVIREVESTYVLVDTVVGTFQNDEQITGGTSGATADVDGVLGDAFTASETVTGGTSASTATVEDPSILSISSPSAAFTDGEWITGGTSGAKIQIVETITKVHVSVENDNGVGNDLFLAFTYTI